MKEPLLSLLHSIQKQYFLAINFFLFGFLLAGTLPIKGQHRDVPFVPTPYETVDEMIKIAGVGPGDYVIDLGSGDGRIVIAAGKKGAFGHGIDIDPRRINEAKRNATKAGVDDKVMFVEGNLFDTDFSKATVVTMYLLNSVNMKLRPIMLEKLKPGTRVVSYYFNMNDWEPDKQIVVNNSDIHYWVIPAKAEGTWKWNVQDQPFTMHVKQTFQKIELELSSGNTSYTISNPSLEGDRIWFTAENSSTGAHYVFHGRIEGQKIYGTIQVRSGDKNNIETWEASTN